MYKERLIIHLCHNMAGQMEEPLMSMAKIPIGKVNVCTLPTAWKSNQTAWMTSVLMEKWLMNFNIQEW